MGVGGGADCEEDDEEEGLEVEKGGLCVSGRECQCGSGGLEGRRGTYHVGEVWCGVFRGLSGGG